MLYKPEFRKKLRAHRLQLDEKSIEHAAKQVAAQIIHLPSFIESQKIGFYIAEENELDPSPTIRCAIDLDKHLYLPVIGLNNDKKLSFYSYHPSDSLVKNSLGILEPDPQAQSRIELPDLDIIFIPLVGFDDQCNRIGRGAGYYDYTLSFKKEAANKKPLLIGLAYEFQKISVITPSKWDVPLDYVITEEKIYQRMPGQS